MSVFICEGSCVCARVRASAGASAGQKRALREFKKRLGGYTSCSDVIWDELFEGLWATG